MITDDRRDDALLDLLYDELPAADAEALRARLAEEDPEGLERLAQWQAIRRVAADLPAPEPDRQMHYDLIREARKAVADESKPFWLWSWLEQLTMRPALAGALLILLAAGLTWRFSQDLESTPDDALDGLPAVEAPQSKAEPKAAATKKAAAKTEEPEAGEALDPVPAVAERESDGPVDAKKELAKAADTTWAPGAQDVPFGADDPGNAPTEEPVGDDSDGRYGAGAEAADQAPVKGLDRLAEKKSGKAKAPAPKAKARRKTPTKRAAKPSPRTANGDKTARGKKAAPARPASKKDTLLDTFADAPNPPATPPPAPAPEPAADAPTDRAQGAALGGLQGGEGFAPPPPAEAAPPAEPEPQPDEVAGAAGPAPAQPVAAAPPPPPPARGESQGFVDATDDLAAAADSNAVEEAERVQASAGGAAEEGRAAATRDSRRRPTAAPVTVTAEAGTAGGDVAGQAVGQRANDEGLRFDTAAAETEEKEVAEEEAAEEDVGDRAVADDDVDRLSRARNFRANNQHRQAAAEYEAYLSQNRGRNGLDQVWWETARTYERLGDTARAIALYRLVVGGGGAFAAQAQARIDALSPPADSKVAPAKAAPAAAPSMDFDEAEAFPASESPRE